ILSDLLESDGEITVAVDSAVTDSHVSGTPDYAWCSRSDNPATWGQEVYLERVGDEEVWNGQAPHGRWVGIVRVTGAGVDWLREALAAIDPDSQLALPALLNRLVEDGRRVRVLYIHGHWMDVNTLADLEQADTFTGAPG
ncbi:MAG: phosphoenolpyruvate mutase, partial [Gammaproteobacteria bacterium]|nr:phosphoenolpyruvate mutase [Gammaproteobacteria bacterium]